MDIRLLGQVEVLASGRVVDVGGPRQRSVLAAVALDAGRPVLADALIYRVWGEDPPVSVRQALYVYVARLRAVLDTIEADQSARVRLVRRGRGYLFDIDPDRVDVHRFNRLVGESRTPGTTDEDRAARLRQALDLWRDTPLGDLSGAWVEQARRGWQRQYLDTVVSWAETELRFGNTASLAGPLTALLSEHPTEESVALVLMRVLRKSGHTTDALDCYAMTRKLLVDQLGIEPGADLQRLHQAILGGEPDPDRDVPGPTTEGSRSSPAPPAQLPLNVPDLVGREAELARMDAMVAEGGPGAARRAACVLTGTAGVGKTALAVRWAHRVTDRFPDGQLYLNLRGFDGGRAAVTPAEALGDLLTGLGVRPEQVPAGVDARAAMYRSRLARRRMLVLLDNARDAEQVRPLMPGTTGCAVVVTSRHQLTSLVAVEGTDLITLDLLSMPVARELLTRRLGAERMAADPRTGDEIIELCARLPLALAIVAARAVTHPAFPLTSMRDELRASRGALNVLDAGDAATNVRTVLSWSYHTLGDQAARLFRLLGLHPGPDITVPAASNLAGMPLDVTRLLLADLVRANMITHHLPGRYRLHDLLRSYAAELTDSIDPATVRTTARHRLFDYYLHSAQAAARLLVPQRTPPHAAVLPGLTVERFPDQRSALDWYQAEAPALAAAVHNATAHGFDTHAWQLGWTLRVAMSERIYLLDEVTIQQRALDAARRCGDRAGQAHIHRGLAKCGIHQGDYAEAKIHLRAALNLAVELDDPIGEADTHLGFGWLYSHQDAFAEALRHVEQSLRLYRGIGHPAEVEACNGLAWCHVQLDNHEEALVYARQALSGYQDSGNGLGEAYVWDTLGACHRGTGDDQEALTCYQRAIELFQENGNDFFGAQSLTWLGDVYQALGDSDAARRSWRRGLGLLARLNNPEATRLRAQLHQRELDYGRQT